MKVFLKLFNPKVFVVHFRKDKYTKIIQNEKKFNIVKL